MKISLVIPVFNEKDNIAANLRELDEYMRGYLPGGEWETIVVNDGSTDGTLEVLGELAGKSDNLRIVDLGANYGRGRALRSGLAASAGEIVVSLDADLSYAPFHIERMVSALESRRADVVVAAAFSRGGSVRNVPFRRLLLSRAGNMVLASMFGAGITVLTCMVRAYRGEFIRGIDLHSDDKEIHLEILAKARILGARLAEVPADLRWREEKTRKADRGKTGKRRSTLKVRRTSASHLFFALMNRPGIIFWVPAYTLMALAVLIAALIASTISGDMSGGLSLYHATRKSMLEAAPSWFTMSGSFFMALIFITLGFLTNQSKRYFEDTYRTLNAIYARLPGGENCAE